MRIEAAAIALLLGFVFDLIVGDPHSLWHPVCGIGWLIQKFEGLFRHIFPKSPLGERVGGTFTVIFVIVCTLIPPALLIFISYRIHFLLGILIEGLLCGQLLATRALKDESMFVLRSLSRYGLVSGQRAVSRIVGRDTERLDESGVVRATVETIAENTSDGVVAPIFYMAWGGVVLEYFFKAVNTMDSMLGYKNEKYRNFGTAAARLDDFCNYLPARISAVLMIFTSYLLRLDGKNARKIFLRDRYNHASPNSAQTESVMAGALDVQLAGDAYYFGELHKKKTIGDPIRPIDENDIVYANKLMYATAVLSVVLMAGIRLLAAMIWNIWMA